MEQLQRGHRPTDELLRTLSDERRREVLFQLSDGPSDVARIPELAAAIDEPSAAPGTADTTDLEIRLHHAHVPALEGAGLVAYDADARTVTYTGSEQAERLLQFVDRHLE